MLPADLIEALSRSLGCTVMPRARAVGGGSIHRAARLDTGHGAVFLKYGAASIADQFEAECAGLRELAQADAVRTPAVLAVGSTAAHAFAAFEWIEFTHATADGDARLGEQLAQLHRTRAARFGWHRDNYIGATPQTNAWSGDWIEFWQQRRLRFQLQLARDNGARKSLLEAGERLIQRVPVFFSGYTPQPSLIHGDLWSGNRGCDTQGRPVIFDPAAYFADREAELAMMRLFGGFHRRFYDAYEAAWPLAAGADARDGLYWLYHVLNHFNLFGGGYHAQAEDIIERLLAETEG